MVVGANLKLSGTMQVALNPFTPLNICKSPDVNETFAGKRNSPR